MLLASIAQYFFGFTIFMVSVFMILLILVQRGRGGGLVGALGGPGGQSAFGTKAGDLFTRITIVTAAIWIVLLASAAYSLKEREKPETLSEGPSLSAPKAESPISGGGAANPETPPATPGIGLSSPAESSGTAPSAATPSAATPSAATPSAATPAPTAPAPSDAPSPAAETPAPSPATPPSTAIPPSPAAPPSPAPETPAPVGSGN